MEFSVCIHGAAEILDQAGVYGAVVVPAADHDECPAHHVRLRSVVAASLEFGARIAADPDHIARPKAAHPLKISSSQNLLQPVLRAVSINRKIIRSKSLKSTIQTSRSIRYSKISKIQNNVDR